ncbi:MAG: AAA family ATPase [Eubacterium sp.]|nr:AAA family ATPase [Eubacterium sp.]
MKLISCHIQNFGKISDLSLDFSDGLNSIREDNGWGKSTLGAFIRAMFYGFEGERKRDVLENERKRYKPWQGGVFGGSLKFEISGKAYEITREFADKEANDIYELRDAVTNKVSNDFSAKTGEELFGINRESFLKTVFIDQNQCTSASTGDINAKIGNISDNTNDINNYERAYAKVNELINHLTPTRKTGSCSKRKELINNINQELRNSEEVENSLSKYSVNLKDARERKEGLEKEKSELEILQKKSIEYYGEYGRIEEKYNHSKLSEKEIGEYEKLKTVFGDETPNDEIINGVKAKITEYSELRTKAEKEQLSTAEEESLEELSKQFVDDIENPNEIANKWNNRLELKSQAEQKKMLLSSLKANASQKQGNNIFPVLLVLGIILLAAGGVVAALVNIYAGIALVAVGIITVILGFILNQNSSGTVDNSEEIYSLETEIENISSRVNDIENGVRLYIEKHGERYDEITVQNTLYNIMQNQTKYTTLLEKKSSSLPEEEIKQMEELGKNIKDFLSYFGYESTPDKFPELIYKLADDAKTYRNLSSKKAEFEEAKKVYDSVEKDSELPSVEEISQKISVVADKLDEVNTEISNYKNNYDILCEQSDELEEKREKLEELNEIQTKETQMYNHLKIVSDKLTQAKESFTSKYMNPLLTSFKKYFTMLAGEEADDFRLDADINITKEELGSQRDIVTLSAGYKDMVGIALRAALVDAMYEKEKPMLVMDDPFAMLDDDKVATAKTFLQKLASEYQIVYLTCSEVRA